MQNAKNDLTDPNLPVSERIPALNELIDQVMDEVRVAVSALNVNEGRLFVSEALFRLGTIAIDPLKELYQGTDDLDVRFHVALLLLSLGDDTYVGDLIAALKIEKSEDICLIANKLKRGNITEAVEPLTERLLSTGQVHEILCLLEALQVLSEDAVSQYIVSAIHARITRMFFDATIMDSFVPDALQIMDLLNIPFDAVIVEYLQERDQFAWLLRHYGYTNH